MSVLEYDSAKSHRALTLGGSVEIDAKRTIRAF